MCDFEPDKPFVDYPEMVDLLRSRNLEIINEQIPFAIHSLQTYSYYDLINGNSEKLQTSLDSDDFVDGVSIDLLVRIKSTEERLRSTFLSQILAIEKKFSTKLAWYISKNFGVDSRNGGYLKKNNYSTSNNSMVNSTMKRLRDVRDLNNNSRKPSSSLKYYSKKHNHIPPWILINDLMFGEVIRWYRCLKDEGKTLISIDLFILDIPDRELRVSILLEVLDLLREYRNFLAHNSSLSKIKSKRCLNSKNITSILNLPHLLKDDEFKQDNSQNLYACFISILLLSTDIDQLQFFVLSIQQIYNTLEPHEQKLILEDIFGLPSKIFEITQTLVSKNNFQET